MSNPPSLFYFLINVKHRNTFRQPVSIWLLNCRYDCIPRVAKLLGYKIVRPTNIQMPNKTSIVEFNYELRLSHKRNQEQDMWNLCWTDSLVAVDFCRDMRRFQKINVSSLCIIFTLISHAYSTAFSRNV
jgi:hypothetical protein